MKKQEQLDITTHTHDGFFRRRFTSLTELVINKLKCSSRSSGGAATSDEHYKGRLLGGTFCDAVNSYALHEQVDVYVQVIQLDHGPSGT
jgi:ribonuclease PH